MNMNNEVRDARGQVIGFRCHACWRVVDSMWGVTCNACREAERRHQELLAAIREGRTAEGKNDAR